MTRAENELALVLNAADCDEGFLLASSTWPRWTRLLDRLVTEGLATCEDIRDREGERIGGNYKINAGVLRIRARTKLKPKRALSDAERATLGERLARARAGERSRRC